MTKKARFKTESPDLRIPQSRADAEEFIAEIGRLQRQRQRLEADMNDRLAAIKQEFEAQAQPLGADIMQLNKGVHVWCEANRAQLTQDGKVKFCLLASGKINWRTRPPKVGLRGKEAIIEACKKLGLLRFIRVAEDINKEAMLAEPEVATSIQGVSITQGEDFVVTPFETELEEVA
jgi:phage host-nuclease inhibitor protein Gam